MWDIMFFLGASVDSNVVTVSTFKCVPNYRNRALKCVHGNGMISDVGLYKYLVEAKKMEQGWNQS